MKIVIALYLGAVLGAVGFGIVASYAPRCQPGDTAIRVGHMLLAGCQ